MNTKNENERKTEMKKILMILVITMLAALPVSGQIPRLINYQGVLTDDMGVVVSDGSHNMTFRLYDVPSGGSHLWEETIAVNVSKGIFNTTLGHDIPIDEDFDKPLYLALEINGGGELSPRRIFTANAYAFSARALYGVSNIFPAEGNVGIGLTSTEAPLHIYTTITDPNTPALLIQNAGNHSLIDFKLATVTEARIRYSSSNDFFFGTLTANGGVSLRTNDLTRLRITGPGDVGVGTVGPLEKLDVNGAIRLGTTAESNEGTIRWTGSDFEGYDGSVWNSLTTGGGSGLPAGSSTNTLRHDGATWVAADNLTNTGTNIGIGTASPAYPLHIVNNSGQVGLRVDGYDSGYSSIYVNAATAPAIPSYGYLRESVLRGYHYLDSSYGWNLWLQGGGVAMLVEPNGWTTFGGVGLAESMNLPGALRLGNTAGNNAGTIQWTGSDFEGYNGSSWNSLTASGLPAGTTGQTLRYDGGWIADSNFWNDGSEIGIGTTEPDENLHIYEDVNAWMGIRIENPSSESGSGEQITFIDENGSLAGIRLYDDLFAGAYSGSMAIYNNRPSGSILFRTGGQNRMRLLETGYFEFYDGTDVMSKMYPIIHGGVFTLYDETAVNEIASLEPDGNSEGGYFYVRRNATSSGFVVDGNHSGTEGTRVDIIGPSVSIAFDASETGDNSVELPPDALSAVEILDEPGAGYDWRAAVYNLDGGITSVAVRTVTVPAAGYVIVWGTAEVQIDHTTGTADHGRLGVSADEISYPGAQNNDLKLDSGLATGVYNFPVTVHGLFEVAGGGAFTYYLIGSEFSGVVSVNKSSLTALYIPTAYGPVDALSASYGSALSDSDPTLERREAEAFNDARLERELAAMRERIATLESQLGNK